MDAKKLLNADCLIGLAVLAFSTIWIALGMQYPPGTNDGVPGCGTFPILASIALAAMAAALIIRSFLHPAISFDFAALPRYNVFAIAATFVTLIAYLTLWRHFGYLAATLFMTASLGFIYKVNWKTAIAFSLIFSFSTYCVFGKFFMIYMELH